MSITQTPIAIVPAYTVPGYTDVYGKSSAWIEARKDGKVFPFVRTGITPPGYPCHPVYGPRGLNGLLAEEDRIFYVLECGHLWPSSEWNRYYRTTGRTPGQDN